MTFCTEIASITRRYLETEAEISGDMFVSMAMLTDAVYGSDYVQANRIRTKFMNITARLFENIDVIATPTQRSGATKMHKDDHLYGRMDGKEVQGHSEFLKLANFVGIPAITIPLGFDQNDMPIGFHLMAKWVKYLLLIFQL